MIAPATPPRVGLVTVLYNSASVLDDFLDSVESQTQPGVRLYAVDNASRDETPAMVADRIELDVRYLPNPDNRGVAEGNNQGIRAALEDDCEWILLVNNDTSFPADLVETMVGHAEADDWKVVTPVIAATSPPDTVWYGGGHVRWAEGMLGAHENSGVPLAAMPTQPVTTRYAPTCCLLVHRTVFETVGMMDPDYFVYLDDVDFMVRLRRAGIPLILDRSVVITHKVSALTGGPGSHFSRYWESRNWILVQRKQAPNPVYRAYCLAFIVAWQLARIVLRRDSLRVAARRLEGFRAGLTYDFRDPERVAPRLDS